MDENDVMIIILEEMQRREQHNNLMRHLRDESNPFNTIPKALFRKMYRFPKDLAHDLFLQINPYLEDGIRVTKIPKVVQFIGSLHFYAHGSYQKSIGKDRDCPSSQASVSRYLRKITNAIVNNLSQRYIQFPETIEEITIVKNGFFDNFNFPGVVGCIDGTHFSIFPPPFGGIPPRLVYLNRKNFHSINCQIVICDANLKILNINARYPGSVHDSAIWMMSNIFPFLNANYRNGDRTTWLLGDSGYPLQPFLLTPIVGADPNTPEGRYTNAHCRTRNTVERCIGVLKAYFRCLNKDRVLHYKPDFAAKLIICCATLYNVLRTQHIDDNIEPQEENIANVPLEDNNFFAEGNNIRNILIRNHFV